MTGRARLFLWGSCAHSKIEKGSMLGVGPTEPPGVPDVPPVVGGPPEVPPVIVTGPAVPPVVVEPPWPGNPNGSVGLLEPQAVVIASAVVRVAGSTVWRHVLEERQTPFLVVMNRYVGFG
jgi:hypothetical protein